MKPIAAKKLVGKKYSPSILAEVLILFFLYVITARIGLGLDAVSGFATLFWLPTGISLVAVLLFGYRVFPGIFFGAFVANMLSGASFPVALGISIGNTGEALLGTYLLRAIGFSPSLGRLRDVLGLIVLAAFISTLVSATIGTISLLLSGALTAPYISTWIAWWIGDMISNVVVAPFLLIWSRNLRIKEDIRFITEEALVMFAIVGSGVFVFWGLFGIEVTTAPLTYLVFPPLIWAAIRFGQREVASGIFILSLLAVFGTAGGHGPFAGDSLSESLIFLQSFMIVVSVTSLILCAAVTERRVFEKRKDDFISFASHELKTPITSLKIYTEMLKRVLQKGQSKKSLFYIRRIDIQVGKLVSLINTMLDVSQMQSATMELSEGYFSLQALLREAVDTMRATTTHSITVQGVINRDVFGDKERIGQVVSNLLSNAIKYSPHHRKILITIRTTAKFVTISIKDGGKGIAKEHQRKIFERFYRIADDGSQTQSGLGIGLYLSKTIIERHGGIMRVKSALGKGSTFSFSLPLS